MFVYSFDAVQIYPKLRFGKEDRFSVIGFLTPPVGKSGESKQIIAEVDIPCSGQLEIVR